MPNMFILLSGVTSTIKTQRSCAGDLQGALASWVKGPSPITAQLVLVGELQDSQIGQAAFQGPGGLESGPRQLPT